MKMMVFGLYVVNFCIIMVCYNMIFGNMFSSEIPTHQVLIMKHKTIMVLKYVA